MRNLRDSDADAAVSSPAIQEHEGGSSQYQTDTSSTTSPVVTGATVNPTRQWRDVFWLFIFILHLLVFGSGLGLLGANRFKKADRLNIDRFTNITLSASGLAPPPPPPLLIEDPSRHTETFWPFYGAAAGIGLVVAWSWLALLGRHAELMMRVSVHGLTTYLAVVSVFCFWAHHFFWGVGFAVGAALQFLYLLSVFDRFPFTMLVLQKSVKMVWSLPEVVWVVYTFTVVMLCWLVLWSFGVAGIVALSIDVNGRWWLLVVFSVSLFWTGAVLCNTVHVIVSGMVFLVLLHGGRGAATMPPKPLLKTLWHALTTNFGSICYGSLFTAAIRTVRWEIRGVRSRIGNNECLLCCIDFLFHLVETLVRFFNKYAYVLIAVHGKSFNRSARDAWELFQSTGVEALVAYDCSGAVLLMTVVLGGLIAGTGTVVVVESAVTSIYICFAEDPALIERWDLEFFGQLSEALHQRLQYRSARARQTFNNRLPDLTTI
ncbi:CTL-like protein [Carex littledalei]|uniref:Choline transporter-like protein n=1 Tax=Carex littledalei TaxID=544730 RepID=A0A833VFV9_9POAL|nr:CTL-like protein [Carex littledalei]